MNLYLYPNADISSGLTPQGESNNYECVDETFGNYNEDTDYVHTNGTTEVEDIYGLPDHTTESGTINYVIVNARCKSHEYAQSPTGIYKLLVNIGGTTYYSADKLITMGYSTINNMWIENPDTDSAWTWTNIDDLRIGVKCNSPTTEGALLEHFFRPNAAGSANGGARWLGCYGYGTYVGAGGGSNWSYVDEEIPDDCDTVIAFTTTGRDSYNIPNHTTETGAIQKVTIFLRARGYYSQVSVNASLRINGSYYDHLLTGFPKTYFETKSKEYALNPDDSAAWEWADIDALEIGFERGSSTSNQTQVYIVVQYIEDVNPDIRTTQCFAVVNYTPSAIDLVLDNPKAIRDSYGRKIGMFSFPDGEYRIGDFGVGNKTLVLSGTQLTDSASKMQTLKEMKKRGETVTITGLDDSDLNDDYVIRSVRKTEEGGSSTITYDYEIVLERTD